MGDQIWATSHNSKLVRHKDEGQGKWETIHLQTESILTQRKYLTSF